MEGGLEMKKPARASVKAQLVSAEVLGFVSVKVSVELRQVSSEDGLNASAMVGFCTTVSVAVLLGGPALMPPNAVKEEVVLAKLPAAAVVTSTVMVQEPLAASVPFCREMPVSPAASLAVLPAFRRVPPHVLVVFSGEATVI